MKKTILKNKKINLYYTIIKKYQAGIILYGWEVQAIKKKNININNSYIKINKNNIPYLIGVKISPLQNINKKNKERKIKILLKKKEIISIKNKIKTKKYTLISLSLIIKKSWYKIIIGLSKGKKKYEKKKYIRNKKFKKKIDL